MRFSAAIFGLLAWCAGAACVQAQSIAELFALAPAEAFGTWNETFPPLTVAARQRLTQADEKAREEAADKLLVQSLKYLPKNGYISFSSKSDGEGLSVQLTYWKEKKGGLCLLAVAVNIWTAAGDATGPLHFYEWSPAAPKTLRDVTAQHLPKLGPADFFQTTPKIAAETEKGGWKWRWILPEKGTTIRVVAPEVGDDTLYTQLGEPKHEYLLEWSGFDFGVKKVAAAKVE